MSCNILPEILHPFHNKKVLSYLLEYHRSSFRTPREFVIADYSHKIFAQNLLKGIEL